MLTHDGIWKAIDRLAQGHGYSTSGLARQAGLDPTSFNKSKRMSPDGKPRWPSTESIAKILSVTGANMRDFLALAENGEAYEHPRYHIPVIGYAQAGEAGYFDDAGYPVGEGWDTVEFPDFAPQDSHAIYALEVNGDSMRPLYRPGDVMIVDPDARLRRGDRVIARTEDGEVTAKELARYNKNKVELRALNPDHEDRSLKPSQLSWIARILWVSQ
jgi:phage repressor protein C with HTH and peptisase S24 domain